MKRVLLSIFIFCTITACSSSSSTSNLTEENKVEESKTEQTLINHWKYTDKVDRMEGSIVYYAESESTNSIEFDFPYQGGSKMTIVVRNMNKSNELLLTISKGQFMTSIGDRERVKIKFDDESPMNVSYNSPTNGKTEVIFLSQSKKIIEKLKTAKKVMIQAPFYEYSGSIFEFEVSGLEWLH